MINREQVEAIVAENQQLQQMVAQQQQLLNSRSEPLLTAVIDALHNVAGLANQGHPVAQQILERWRSGLEAAATSSKITVVRDAGTGNGKNHF